MTTHTCDVAVIGAGTAGISAERSARRQGAKTLLIDPEFAGTTCATVGCMPSKLLIAAADAAHGAQGAAAFGVMARPEIDGRRVMARLRELRDGFVAGVRDMFASLPDGTCLTGRARFEGPGELSLGDGTRVQARTVVIATGARPFIPDAFEAAGDLILTNETLFELEDLPGSIGVIGAGPLGIELAQALARLGVRVELFERDRVVAGLPAPTGRALCDILRREFPIRLNVSPAARRAGAQVELDAGGATSRFDRLLIGAGRPPALDGLNLAATGLELDDRGMPDVDSATLQCCDAPVFMAGDANAARPLLHEAADEGTIAGRNAALFPDIAPGPRKVAMGITFTRPAAAVIGTIPDTGKDGALTGCSDYSGQGRARVMDRAAGSCRIHADREGRLIGADLCAPGGEHLAHLLAWAVSWEKTAADLLELPFYHPTLEEGLRPALREICAALGQDRPWNRDDGPTPGC